MPGWMFGAWIRIAWWTPEARAFRDECRYAGRVVQTVARLSQAPEPDVEAAVQQAFLALHRRYCRGRTVQDVRTWAARYALTIMDRKLVK
jgi:DNA-directed RNA polymerase specialized sigma24 family protein